MRPVMSLRRETRQRGSRKLRDRTRGVAVPVRRAHAGVHAGDHGDPMLSQPREDGEPRRVELVEAADAQPRHEFSERWRRCEH